ncbi:hypothetical protein [Aquirufa ecclesiirivi]|uniref:DUF7936 family protein n=1 Tax=Aquirufa ecclesiirivi TaxID=2715124 RepID=UPI003BB191A1
MAKTFSWVVSKAEAIQKLGELNNVVSDIHFRRVITDENGNATDIFDIAKIPAPSEGEEFISADQLSFEDYCAMLEKHLDVKKIDKDLNEKFLSIYPPVIKVELQLPWSEEATRPQSEIEVEKNNEGIENVAEIEAEWERPWVNSEQIGDPLLEESTEK